MDNTSENRDKALIDIIRRLSHLIIGFGAVIVIGIIICLFTIPKNEPKNESALKQSVSNANGADNQVSIDYNQISKIIADELATQIGNLDYITANELNEKLIDIIPASAIGVSSMTTDQVEEVINQVSAGLTATVTDSISDYVSETDKQAIENAKAAFALARSSSDIDLANLYYLNAINSDPSNIEILSSYKDFLIENRLDDLIGSFMEILYNIGQIADYSILPEIFSINDELIRYQNEMFSIPQYEEGFVLSDINRACDKFDSLLISDSSFSDLTSAYLDILDMQDNCIETIDTDTENRLIIVDQFYSFSSAYNTAENIYAELSELAGEVYINQYPVFISSLQSCYDVFNVDISIYNDTAKKIIEKKRDSLDSFLESAEEMYHQEFKNVINQAFSCINKGLHANYSCSVLLAAALNTSDYDSISVAIQKLNNEIHDINRNRLVAYQTWAYETMMDVENMIDSFSKKTIVNAKILSIQQSGFLSVDRSLLSYQLQAVYDETLSLIHDEILKDESSKDFYYSKLAETPIKQLEDF